MATNLLRLEVQVLHGNRLARQLVRAHVHFAEASLAEMLLKFESIDSNLVVKVLAQRIKQCFLLEKILQVVIRHLDSLHSEKADLALQLSALVVLVLQLL